MLDPRHAWLRRLIALAAVLALWEAAGRAGLLNPLFAPSPSKVWVALVDLFFDGRIWPHLEATFSAALGGLALGIVVGAVLGVAAALLALVAELLEPVMSVLNAIPRVILALSPCSPAFARSTASWWSESSPWAAGASRWYAMCTCRRSRPRCWAT